MSKEKVLKIIADAPTAIMATVEGNNPRVRPMMIKKVWDKIFYVSTYADSNKIQQIEKNPNTEILWIDSQRQHVRIAGKAFICQDVAKKNQYFKENEDVMKMYFKGKDDPNYILLEVKPEKVLLMEAGSMEYQEIAW